VPTLYVVPTPIGNLEDITLRALRVLREVTLVLAEDTRHTRKLLTHYSIRVPLQSYHQHNKLRRLDWAMDALRQGNVALVSDAGMPALADPGFELIHAARSEGHQVDVLPGASAVVTAVVAAALPAPGFVFMGFLPRRSAERKQLLASLSGVPYTLVGYESPHRLVAALRDVSAVLGTRVLVVARELTKIHQEVTTGTADELIARFATDAPRGEITLLVAGAPAASRSRTGGVREGLRQRALAGEDRRAALKEAVNEYGISRNEAYRMWLELTGDGEDG
jgi:16S rRNA (cytidine1402-2'-O)-methyltransferase